MGKTFPLQIKWCDDVKSLDWGWYSGHGCGHPTEYFAQNEAGPHALRGKNRFRRYRVHGLCSCLVKFVENLPYFVRSLHDRQCGISPRTRFNR